MLLASYAAYSIWFTSSLLNGSFLSDDLAMYKPNGHEPTFAELMELNPDVCAWITIDDTSIDYPVVQGADDSKYLNKSVEGDFSLAGAIFLTVQNAPDFSDSYNVIYGHRIEGGAMFADIFEFLDKGYFEAHPTGILWLADSAFSIEVFACVEVDALDEVVYQNPADVTPEALSAFVTNVSARATQKRDVAIAPGDHVVALSTCESVSSFNRVVLFGKMVPLTDAERAAAELANYEDEVSASDSGARRAPSIFQQHPWLLPSLGLFLLLVIFLIVRLASSRRH